MTKIKTEKETRAQLLNLARAQGCEPELRKIFDRYDCMAKQYQDETSRKQMAVLGAVEVHRLLNVRGGLAVFHTHNGQIVSGEQIIPHDPSVDEIKLL